MKKIFNYNKSALTDEQNKLVESFGMLCDKFLEGKSANAEYEEANKQFNEKFMENCVNAIPNVKFENIEQLKNPMIHKNIFFLTQFETVLAQMITPVVPTVVAAGFENLYDVTQVGWGDNAKYFVESNEMFIVSDAAVGVARGGVQTMFNTEYTVQASKKETAAYVDWYHVAS